MLSILSAAKLWVGSKPDALATLERRIKTILPEEYQETYQTIEPVSMGSASLKYGEDGKVAWDDIWDTFCDLAMAGGPPHKGKLLEPASPTEIAAQPERYNQVVQEICRGIRMVTSLAVMPAPTPGWVRVDCGDPTTASWMTRAIVMENVSARYEDTVFYVPAGPEYRIEKEIKNVITVMAKTGHYFLDHVSPKQHKAIAAAFAEMERELPLVQPSIPEDSSHRETLAAAIHSLTGLNPSSLDRPRMAWPGNRRNQTSNLDDARVSRKQRAITPGRHNTLHPRQSANRPHGQSSSPSAHLRKFQSPPITLKTPLCKLARANTPNQKQSSDRKGTLLVKRLQSVKSGSPHQGAKPVLT